MSSPALFLLTGSLLAWAAASKAGKQETGPASFGASSAPQEASASERSQPSALIAFEDGRLTLRLENQSLDLVLEKISDQTGVAILSPQGVTDRAISIRFDRLPLEEGLRRILGDLDAFFYYGAAEKTPARLKVVWVYPKGAGRDMAPVPPELWASTRELEAQLADPDAEVRSRAIEALIERKQAKALEAVMDAMRDEDAAVRARALYRSLRSGLELPPETLRSALEDPSSNVRFLALEALADHPEARAIVEPFLEDPSPYVQSKAREILERWNANPEPRPPDQRWR